MASLPTEIITEILARLSMKSLTRFSCVNKSWFYLIRTPYFIKSHVNKTLILKSEDYLIIGNRSIHIGEINLEDPRSPISFSELQHPLKPYEVNIIGSCNGILCVSDNSMNNVFIYNPLTYYCQKIPVKHTRDSTNWWNSRVVYGFGFDSITDDYKVCSIFQKLKLGKVDFIEAQVFSFKNNSWKSIEGISECDCTLNSHGIYLNEAIYYVDSNGPDIDLRRKFITKFDCRTDTLLRVECPNYDKFNADALFWLSAFDGCLCMLISYFSKGFKGETIQVDLWMMKRCRENEAWVKLFSIPNPQSIGIRFVISVITFSKDRSKILSAVDWFEFGWYDLDSGLFERIIPCGQSGIQVFSKLYYISRSLVFS